MQVLSPSTQQVFTKLNADLTRYWRTSAPREKLLISFGVLAVVLYLLSEIITPIRSTFVEQSLELEKALGDTERVTTLLKEYVRLKARRDEIEHQYREVERSEGALSQIEKAIREKLGISPGLFTITERNPLPFGLEYEQRPYNVKFKTTNVKSLATFLNDITTGSQPLLVTRLEMVKSFGGDRLDVDLDVSSISRRSQQ